MKRRQFIEWLGQGAVSFTLLPYATLGGEAGFFSPKTPDIVPLSPSANDALLLAKGLRYDLLVKWGDSISAQDTFGFNNDFLCFVPIQNKSHEGILWVNHEYVDPYFMHGSLAPQSLAHVREEQYAVGGSLLHLEYAGNTWQRKPTSAYNRRLTAETMIPFHWDEPIVKATHAKGTLGNCAGGFTPWGTILTCEENYHFFYGERDHETNAIVPSERGWETFDPQPPEHYGWVVEVDPFTGKAQKHVALGRCAHECATVAMLNDGRVVVYTGDDKNDEHLYKYVSSKPRDLKEGKLYVAQLERGEWLSLDIREQPVLAAAFTSQTEVLIQLRKAAKLVGATPLDRPEDIEIDPVNGQVLVTLTNNVPKGNYFGSILKIKEHQNDHSALMFEASTLLTGGEETGFAAPDNLIFDRLGNLWFTSDISGSKMNKPPYERFKNNGLFVMPRHGKQAGQVLQIASAPVDAELTGPCFSPDGRTLFLSVQHPGEQSSQAGRWTSNWPHQGDAKPRSAVVTIQGPLLNQLQGIR
ncbi:hypothetical protein SAMN05421823_12016 [Catalinimonas alkaloidigena]|uniref:Uncharacterized protein n=1 Tax=Catalinimonas alkaloidigena TaxID=1075417 RepID=A0A1G9VF94_9BACT|nr:alkaline phosphatase PhoX [Catalinimonas alkaloidigena]SDM70753.1 hypothetical protein SAMN05421823_12016 [Catalinimonas alkaloidigena]